MSTTNLDAILAIVRRGNCCRVLGPRFRFKSRLMRQAAVQLRQAGTHYPAYQSLAELPLTSDADFFAQLYQRVKQDIPGAAALTTEVPVTSAFGFQYNMICLVQKSDLNLALLIDDLEIAPPNLVASLLGALRAIFSTVVDWPGARFQAVVCGSLSLNQVALHNASRFESVSELVLINDLNPEERFMMVYEVWRKAGLSTTAEGIQALLAQTGGDPLLIDEVSAKCIEEMALRGTKKLTPSEVSGAVDRLVSAPPNWRILEAFKQIENNPSLLSCTLRILRRGSVPLAELPLTVSETPSPLDLCGVFEQTHDAITIKANLWARLLQKRLTAAHVGGLYAVAGHWMAALNYFGQALPDEPEVQSELFAATINAMHASETITQAFRFLAHGLQAVYPESDIQLYYRTEDVLKLVFPVEKSDLNQPYFALADGHVAEVSALSGPVYSMAKIANETRFLFPLQPDRGEGLPLGLVSIGRFLAGCPAYQQREETQLLVELLGQAARSIAVKEQLEQLIQTANQRAEKLNALNSILTRILHHGERSEEVIVRVFLAGITSGWGLGFNRAILFMSDEAEQNLFVQQAVGHMTHQEATEDWNTFPYRTLDELIDHLLLYPARETSLAQIVKYMAIPLTGNNDDLVVECYRRYRPILASQQSLSAKMPEDLSRVIDRPREFVLMPLNAGNRTVGVLYVDNKFTKRPISGETFELLQTFVNQAALILANARALAAERKQTNSLTELLQVEEAVNDEITISLPSLFDKVVTSACRLIRADCAVLYPFRPTMGWASYIYEQETEHIATAQVKYAIKLTDKPLSSPMTSRVIQEGCVVVADVTGQPAFPDGDRIAESEFIKRERIRSFVGLRLGTRETPVGVLYVNWSRLHEPTPEELTVIELFANHAGVAIPSARRYQQVKSDLKRRTQELAGLSRVFYAGLEFRSEEGIEEAIKQTLHAAQELTNAPHIYLIGSEPYSQWRTYWLNEAGALQSKQREAIGEGLAGEAFKTVSTQLVVETGPANSGKFPDRYHPDSRSGLAVPVKVSNHCLAVLHLESPTFFGFTAEQQEFLENLAGRLALTLEQAKVSEALRHLLNISLQLTQGIDLQTVLVSIVDQAMNALRTVDTITLYYVERETGQLVLGHMAGVRDEATVRLYPPRSGRVIDQVWKLDGPIFAENVLEGGLLKGAFAMRENICSAAAFPLKVEEERVGCMFFSYRFSYNFDSEVRSLLSLFAQFAALAILQVSLQKEAERRRRRLEIVARITKIISVTLELDEVIRNVLREVKQAVPRAQNAAMVELRGVKLLILPASLEFYRVDLPPSSNNFYEVDTTLQRGIAGRVIHTKQAAIVLDVTIDPDYIPSINSTRSQLCVPIVAAHDMQAALVLESDEINAFTTEDQLLLEMLADHVAIAIQNARQYRELKETQQALELAREVEVRERVALMATGLIHDIRSAVASIPDLVDELRGELGTNGHLAPDVVELLDYIEDHANETDRLGSKLKNFVVTGQFEPDWVELDTLIQRALTLSKEHEPPHVTTYYQAAGVPLHLWADALWIELLLKNLLVNAYEAIPANPGGSVSLTVEVQAENILLRVHDTGPGIPLHMRDNVFELAFTTKGNYGMRGVGLYHCRQIAETHQGQLTVKSEPGQGTTFTLSLPKSKPNATPQEV